MADPKEMTADPRDKRAKRLYMKIFFGNVDLYNEFLGYYDVAVEEGSASPEDKAMIVFREKWIETDEGWQEKIT